MPIALILTYLPQIIQAGESVYDFIVSLRTAANQSGEWTNEAEQTFRDYLRTLADTRAQTPDAKLGTTELG